MGKEEEEGEETTGDGVEASWVVVEERRDGGAESKFCLRKRRAAEKWYGEVRCMLVGWIWGLWVPGP